MPSILAMDWQVAKQLEIRVLDVAIQVGFTESKDASRSVKFPFKPVCGSGSDLGLEL